MSDANGGLVGKSGVLKKLSSRGFWQKRHVRLQNRYLLYAKKARAAAPDVSIDLEAVVNARLVSRHGDFVIEFSGGRLLHFRARGASCARVALKIRRPAAGGYRVGNCCQDTHRVFREAARDRGRGALW